MICDPRPVGSSVCRPIDLVGDMLDVLISLDSAMQTMMANKPTNAVPVFSLDWFVKPANLERLRGNRCLKCSSVFWSAFIDVIRDHDSSWQFNIQHMRESFRLFFPKFALGPTQILTRTGHGPVSPSTADWCWQRAAGPTGHPVDGKAQGSPAMTRPTYRR